MRTLMIVDDEKNIRLGLSAMISREFPEEYRIELACDGAEALAKLEGGGTDLLITDIRMPKMDGIALMKRIREMDRRPLLLVLSGHDDFAYAKEAIQCEVKGYLLKPIVREELFAALRRLEGELRRQEELSSRLAAGSGRFDALRASQLAYILLHPGMEESEVRERLESVGAGGFGPGWAAGVLRFPAAERPQRLEEAVSRLERLLPEGGAEVLRRVPVLLDKDRNLVLLGEGAEVGRLLEEALAGGSASGLRAGLSFCRKEGLPLRQIYLEALSAMRSGFLYAGGGVRRYEAPPSSGTAAVPLELIRRLSNLLGTRRSTEVRALLSQLLDPGKARASGVAYVEAVSRSLNELVFDQVFHAYGEESVEILRLYKKAGSIDHFDQYHEYVHSVEQLTELLDQYIASIRAVHADHKEIKRAVQYIEENYAKNLNMAMVSNHVSLSYTYFSQAFKEYTGENFVGYLKKVRIRRAKELLEREDGRIYEIAEQVGFENTKQFNRVFKEMEGITPMEYRSKRSLIS
ncbi:response regulator transcription factor [Paenibacillus caseinilyticus]|uniref:Response regulator receiver n=2 Tax=Paenibacillus mucilaginosus TaxID=61624 RepID=I0BP20_9BACL|nr:response regulator [Paenibacillus mucilaginosus]AFH64117.1 response regulator receiver [Paenibacillus mucilaginosus K02]